MSNAPTSRKRKFEDTPYDPHDANAVNAFWKDATVTPGGGVKATLDALKAARGRGPGKRPVKEAINIRLSPDVLSAFRATGTRWQTRIDAALREWLKGNPAR